MAEIIVDYSETGNRFKKYQNSWNVEPGSGFPEAPRPAVGDVVTLTGYTVNPYTPTETASVQFHYVEEGGDRYLIEANTREGATPIYAAGVDDAIASGTVSFTITDVEEGDEVWIVSMVFGTPPIEEKALGGNAVTFFREKIEGMVGDLSDLTTTDKTNLVAAINEAAAGGGGGGGGGSATIFYMDSGIPGWGENIEGPLFYKDSSYQTPATSSEIYAACMAGTTYICSNQSDDLFYTEIVAASNYSTNYSFSLTNIEHGLGYDCTISSYIRSGTEYYSFYYNEPSTINVVQTTGSSTTNVMSQNAVTTGLAGKQDTLTAGANITIDANNVISAAGGGETMLVTLTQTTIGQYSDIWVWSSDYTFAQLTANPDAIRVFVNDWCYASEGNIKPTDTKVRTSEQSTEIYLVRDLAGVEMSFILRQPRELEGQTVNPAIFDVTNFVDKNKTALLILPTLTLADNATYIPDGTTITLQTLSSDKEMYSVNGNSDCYPHERIINGNFMILPVRRKVGSGASSWVEEECLVMSASRRGTSNVADSYIYKTFAFNGEHYKMTLTSDSYPNVVYTITKIPGGGGGVSLTMSTTDIGEGASLPANTLYGVYE